MNKLFNLKQSFRFNKKDKIYNDYRNYLSK